jgi:glycosyltransferase involved in cell wall biosynthesis
VPLGALPRVPVLHVSSTPPVPWLGGVPAQLGSRLRALERIAPTALAYPHRRGLRVEVSSGGSRFSSELAFDAAGGEGSAWSRAVRRAAHAIGAELLHVEGAAGFAQADLLGLSRDHPMLLALHDFALFCPRPNLFDEVRGADCGGCAAERDCHGRLADSDSGAAASWGWRARGAAILSSSRCVVYSSAFLRREHDRLFGPPSGAACVIEPGIVAHGLPPRPWPSAATRPRARIGFVGGGHAHKGAPVLESLIRTLGHIRAAAVDWEVFGGGGSEQLRRLRRLPRVRVHGYFRHGTLPARLRARRVDLCVMLPQFPESFSLTLSEMLAAGVPVLAPRSGALPDRLSGGGGMLSVDASVEQVAAALGRWLDGDAIAPAPRVEPPTAASAAGAYAALHAELLASSRGASARAAHA